MDLAKFKQLLIAEIKNQKRIGIITHKNPDGDGLSCCFAFQAILRLLGRYSEIILDDRPLWSLEFLGKNLQYIKYSDSLDYDLIVIFDAHNIAQLGLCGNLIKKSQSIFVLDHHEINDPVKGSVCFIDPTETSTGIILHKLFFDYVKSKENFDHSLYSNAIYASILHDTNIYHNNNITKECYRIPLELLDYSLDPVFVKRTLSPPKKPEELDFFMKVFRTRQCFFENKLIMVTIGNDILKDENFRYFSYNFTDFFASLTEYQVLVVVKELSYGKFKISLRSTGIDVSLLANQMGGGGHKLAAGFETSLSEKEFKKKITSHFKIFFKNGQ